MSNPNFIDHIKIFCKSGNGGRGSSSFRREKFVPLGGPDGGDGGKGGDIILKGNSQLWTLLHLRYTKHLKAENGEGGQGNKKHGKNGKDIIIEVPLGTIARSAESDNTFVEILSHNEEKILLEGGIGGLGNVHFKTSTKQAPQYSQPGIKGIEEWINLELKVLADVGLVGFPNAGKSSLLAALTSAKPKIADYEFTTLKPNLGIVDYRDYRSFVMADIPGIIEGAAEGKGLGYYFLRHIERNSILLFVIPSDSKDVKAEFEVLHNELKQYNPELLDKKFMVIISKGDLLDDELKKEYVIEINTIFKVPSLVISSFTQYNLSELKDSLWKLLNE